MSPEPTVSTTGRLAVFLDRDGTIVEDRGHLRRPEQAVFFPDTVGALRLLTDRFALFIVTNQPGIAEGVVTAREVHAVNRHVCTRLASVGISIVAVYVCPHRRSDGCTCIKPNPWFLLEAARRHGLDLTRSYVVGDHPHDVELARRAGATGVYLLTGHGTKHRADVPPGTVVVPGILEAALVILKDLGGTPPAGVAPESDRRRR